MTSSTSSTSSTYNVQTSKSGQAQISGLASGIDTSSLIESLMKVEAQPQTQLKAKLTSNQAQTSVLQAINTKLAALATSASALSSGTALGAATATSSTPAITATVTGTPQLGTLSVSAATPATASQGEFVTPATTLIRDASGNTGGWVSPTGASFAFTIAGVPGATPSYNLTATSGSAADVAAAINASGSGVQASLIYDSTAKPHLYLTAPTGQASVSGSPVALSMSWGGGATTALSTASAGTDASLTVNGITKTQNSNTFTDVINGLNLTLNGSVSSPATVTTQANTSAVVKSVSDVVTSLASVLADIRLATTAPASGTTASATNGGLLAGDSTLRTVIASLMSTITGAIGSAVPSGQTIDDAGISTDSTGIVSVDTTKLTAFLTNNANVAQSVLTNFGTALSSAASTASNPGIGTVSTAIKTLQSSATDLTKQISDWDLRLALRQSTLQAQYTAMETALSKLQAQSNTLTQALKSLESSNN